MYAIISYDKQNQIDAALEEQLRFLDASYKQGLDRFNVIAHNVYISIQNDEKLVNIIEKASKQNELDSEVHDEVYDYYKDEFAKLQLLDVLHVQFVMPNGKSLIRMHKPKKFGDHVEEVRYSFQYVNKEKVSISGFEEGRTSHAFRHVYPLYKEGKFIALVDVGFSSTMLQNYTMRANNVHTHFIVNKNVFKTVEWKSNNEEPYEDSVEHKDFMFSLSDHVNHDRLSDTNAKIMTPLRTLVDAKIATKKEFAIYKETDNKVRIVAFLPVSNIKGDEAVAYLVSYTDSKQIETILKNFKIVILSVAFVLMVLLAFVYQSILHRKILKHELQYDGLTKVFNRKYFLHVAEDAIEKSKKGAHDISVVMVDIDFFKKVNDTYGHQAGDEVLVSVAKILSSSLRELDIIARYGGEEFIIFMMTDAKNAFDVIEKIRLKIENFTFADKPELKITVSFGIAQHHKNESLEELIKRADRALYQSKNGGRNRITLL
jgi:diguanylate cyclase (GGDEF)-like protein